MLVRRAVRLRVPNRVALVQLHLLVALALAHLIYLRRVHLHADRKRGEQRVHRVHALHRGHVGKVVAVRLDAAQLGANVVPHRPLERPGREDVVRVRWAVVDELDDHVRVVHVDLVVNPLRHVRIRYVRVLLAILFGDVLLLLVHARRGDLEPPDAARHLAVGVQEAAARELEVDGDVTLAVALRVVEERVGVGRRDHAVAQLRVDERRRAERRRLRLALGVDLTGRAVLEVEGPVGVEKSADHIHEHPWLPLLAGVRRLGHIDHVEVGVEHALLLQLHLQWLSPLGRRDVRLGRMLLAAAAAAHRGRSCRCSRRCRRRTYFRTTNPQTYQ